MAFGTMIKLGVATTGNNPVLYPDPLLSKGSIWLMDESRTAETNYVQSTSIRNLARSIAAPILGVSEVLTDSTLSVSPGGEYKVEKTTKGGLHFQSTAAAVTAGRNIVIPFSSAVLDYFYARVAAGDKFYASFEGEITRDGTVDQKIFSAAESAYTSKYLFYMRSNSTSGPTTGRYESGTLPYPAGTPFMKAVHIQGVTNAAARNLLIQTGICLAGSGGNAGNPCFVVRQAYLENLTLSGRTFDQVRDLQIAIKTAYLAEGGRFYGDTWNTPMA